MKFSKEICTILCDDIRQEIGNKVSLMGIYGKDVLVAGIPFVFSKLCLWVTAKDVQHEIHGLKVVVNIPKSEQIILELPEPAGNKKHQDVQIGMAIAPLKIESEGKATIDLFLKGESKPFASHVINIKKSDNAFK
jgi:hypothetical protein